VVPVQRSPEVAFAQARQLFQQNAWQEAYEALTTLDLQSPLGLEDLWRLT
jgi:hypothetical protein